MLRLEVPLMKKHPEILEHLLKIARRNSVVAEKVAKHNNVIQLGGTVTEENESPAP